MQYKEGTRTFLGISDLYQVDGLSGESSNIISSSEETMLSPKECEITIEELLVERFRRYFETKGRRSRRIYTRKTGALRGPYITYIIPKDPKDVKDVAFDATIKAHILRLIARRGRKIKLPLKLSLEDIREKVRRSPVPRLIIFILDLSGSMTSLQRISLAKGALKSIIRWVYICKDIISLIVFKKNEARVLVEPTRNYYKVFTILDTLSTGGRTPLSHALLKAYSMIKMFRLKHKNAPVYMILVTDGKANVPLVEGNDIEFELKELCSKITALRKVNAIIIDTRAEYEVRIGCDYMNLLINSLKAKRIFLPPSTLT